jgi:hypothetical protein
MQHRTTLSRRAFLGGSLVAAASLIAPSAFAADVHIYEVIIYGGTSAAIVAAVQARRMLRTVAIVCPETHLGGMTASGLGWTDSKNGDAVGGLAREFYHRIWKFYNDPAAWTQQTRQSYIDMKIVAQPGPAIDEAKQVMWTFEPHAAEQVVEAWLAEERIPVFRGEWLDRSKGVAKHDARISSITTLSGKQFRGRMFIDASYEGDLMASAGVHYRVGRDSAAEFGEPLNGLRFPVKGVDNYYSDDPYAGVDPYVVPGQAASGFLPGIEGEWTGQLGDADPKRLQSFNYRLCLTQETDNLIPIEKPAGYDDRQYELLFRLLAAGEISSFSTQSMPNLKTDSNASGRMSGDFVGGSFSVDGGWNYSEASYDRRRQIVDAHRQYQHGLLWTLQNHERVPDETRRQLALWGLAKDEFTGNGYWPYQLYVREARRMTGLDTVTQHHIQMEPGYDVRDPIGLGSYSLDSHVVRRVVMDGKIQDEGGFYVWWNRPYPIPYGCIVPRKQDAVNLLVPVTLSATHAAFGSIRMEPTYMILGQAAATAAVLALDCQSAVQDVPYADLAKRLAVDGQCLSLAGNA